MSAEPRFCAGGFLEKKNGQLCLRLPDEIALRADGKFDFSRRWQPPGRKPFDPKFYR